MESVAEPLKFEADVLISTPPGCLVKSSFLSSSQVYPCQGWRFGYAYSKCSCLSVSYKLWQRFSGWMPFYFTYEFVPFRVTVCHAFPCRLLCIHISETNYTRVLPHEMYRPSLRYTCSSVAWQIHPHHPFISTVYSLSRLWMCSNHLRLFPKTSNLGFTSDKPIFNPIQFGHSKRKAQFFHFCHRNLCLLLSLQ